MFGVSCTDAVINNYLRVLYGDENLSFSEKVTVENLVCMDMNTVQ